jgi:hypothetical protein
MTSGLYMVIEHFKGGDAVPIYRRFRDRGRLGPEGLSYVSSWVDMKLVVFSGERLDGDTLMFFLEEGLKQHPPLR